MRLFLIIIMAGVMFNNQISAQDFPAYKIFDKNGDEVNFSDVSGKAIESDIVFFGELHNNPICHWLQFEVTSSIYESKKENLIIGAEMFESDNQLLIDEYFGDMISQKSFEKECRLWSNHKTDYKPVFEFAKENGLNYIATNIPRRYASLVGKKGFEGLDSLSEEAKNYIAPLPIDVDLDLACYKNMEKMGMSHKAKPDTSKKMKMPKMKNDPDMAKKMKKMQAMMSKMRFFKMAQASKDATMAHFILKNYSTGNTFLHLNGAYHSNNYESIVWFIKKDKPELKILTITTVEKDNFDGLTDDEKKLADYIIVVKSSMTKSY